MIDSTVVLEALSAHGVVAWARVSVGTDPADGLVRVPFVVWRYDDPPSGLDARFHRVAEEFSGSFEWRFDNSLRNWTLTPNFVRSAESRDAGALTRLKKTSQRSCLAATGELEILMAELAGFA